MYMTDKYKGITIKIDSKSFSSKSCWITLKDTGLLYVSWDTGRIYFFLVKNSRKDITKIIKSFILNDKTNTIKFTYYGPWWDEDKQVEILNVVKNCSIIFKNSKKYNEFKKKLKKFV